MVSSLSVLLGLVALLNNPTRLTNRIFALLCVLSSAYGITNYLADHDQSRGLFWARMTFLAAALVLLFMLLFINNFPRKLFNKKWETWAYVLSSIISVVVFLPDFIPQVDLKPDRTDVITGGLYPVFLVYVVIFLVSSYRLGALSLQHGEGIEREKSKYVIMGFFIAALLIAVTNLILPLLLGNNDLSALGSYFTLVFIGFSTFAIIKRRLFNVRMVVARSAGYLLVVVALASMYGVAIFGVSQLFIGKDTNPLFQDGIYTLLSVVLAFTFQPLLRVFQRGTNDIFYHEHYDSQVVLSNFSKILVSERDLDHILKRTITELCESLHIGFGQLVIFNNERVYRVEHFGQLPKRLMVAPELATLNSSMIVADELTGGARKQLMENHGIRVSLTLKTREEFVGYLLLGDKLSGDIYSSQDIELLQIISKQLAVAILNAKAYAQIEEFNLTLQARVDHATNRLRAANHHLKELDKAKDEFISMASHQLRTPLTTIKGYLSMMLEGDSGQLTPAQKEFAGFAYGSSERMVNLISDLLNVSRLSAGRFLIQTKPTDMVAMIADEVRQLATHASAKNIGLIFEPPKEILPPAEIDDNKTRQVVMNFIDNAIYYTQKGEVRVVLEQSGDKVRLEVRDSGIGVPEKAKKKLFTKFFRADNAQIVRPDGTGLGLYLAKRVVEDQGGTIIFNSVEGKGSTFGFELPFTPATPIREVAHAKSHK